MHLMQKGQVSYSHFNIIITGEISEQKCLLATSSNDSYSPGSSTCMQEVSAQQDESSLGLFRGAGCVSSPSPLLLSLSLPFLPPSCLPSPSLFLRSPRFLTTPSYIIYPQAFIIQQRPQQTNIFVRMIRDTMPDDGISTIKGLQTVLTHAMLVADVL